MGLTIVYRYTDFQNIFINSLSFGVGIKCRRFVVVFSEIQVYAAVLAAGKPVAVFGLQLYVR